MGETGKSSAPELSPGAKSASWRNGRPDVTDPNSSEAWSDLDMSTLRFLDDRHLARFDLDSLPPPGTSTSSLTVDVDPDILDDLAHAARATGRTIPEIIQERLRGSTAA
jgi:hypothetical protein